MYLISAYFDEHTTKQLKRYMDSIARETHNTYMIDNDVPPHLTISSFETRNPDNLIEDFGKLATMESRDVNIISVGEFLPYVIYATPVIDRNMQNLADEVYNILNAREDVSISKCYKPYSWFPHITLGKKLDKEQMIKAFEVLQVHFNPIKGRIVSLGLAETNPHRDIARIELKGL